MILARSSLKSVKLWDSQTLDTCDRIERFKVRI